MGSGQCGCPWTAHCDRIITLELYTMTVIEPNHSRLPSNAIIACVRLLHPLVRTKHLEMLFSVQTNCQGVTATEPPFEMGGWGNGT